MRQCGLRRARCWSCTCPRAQEALGEGQLEGAGEGKTYTRTRTVSEGAEDRINLFKLNNYNIFIQTWPPTGRTQQVAQERTAELRSGIIKVQQEERGAHEVPEEGEAEDVVDQRQHGGAQAAKEG